MKHALACLVIACLSTGSWSLTYDCPYNQVLIVQALDTQSLKMHCATPEICNVQIECNYFFDKANCGGHSYFVSSVYQKLDREDVSHRCCAYKQNIPEHFGNQCFTHVLNEQKVDTSLPVTNALEDTAFRIRLFRLLEKTPAKLLVKHILRTHTGYNVSICQPECDYSGGRSLPPRNVNPNESTGGFTQADDVTNTPETTTTTPTTTTPTTTTQSTTTTKRPTTTFNDDPNRIVIEAPAKPRELQNDEEDTGGSAAASASTGGGGTTAAAPPPFACFECHSTVQTPEGHKQMCDLQLGDQVLVATNTDQVQYEPVLAFYHQDPTVQAEYHRLTLQSGIELTLSGEHLLPRIEQCDLGQDELNMAALTDRARHASLADIGDCVLALNAHGEIVPQRIEKITIVPVQGAFSPITESGTVLVNGVHCSCFAVFEDHVLQHMLADYYITLTNIHHYVSDLLFGGSQLAPQVPLFIRSAFALGKAIFN